MKNRHLVISQKNSNSQESCDTSSFSFSKNPEVKSFSKPTYDDPASVPSEEIIATPVESQIQIDNRTENSFEFLQNPGDGGVGATQGSNVSYFNLSMIESNRQNILYSVDFYILDCRRPDSRKKRWNHLPRDPTRVGQSCTIGQAKDAKQSSCWFKQERCWTDRQVNRQPVPHFWKVGWGRSRVE